MGADIGAMAYWAVARLEPHRERLALHCLGLAGFETYFPRLREKRMSHGRRIEVRPPLFPGYCFLTIEAQWHAARWSVGILGLIMDGIRPAKVADSVIEEIRSRERGGLVELPRRDGLKAGDQVRILTGAFAGHSGLYAGMRPHERVLVLLAVLGGQQRVELAKDAVEAIRSWTRSRSARLVTAGRPGARFEGHTTTDVCPIYFIGWLFLLPGGRVFATRLR